MQSNYWTSNRNSSREFNEASELAWINFLQYVIVKKLRNLKLHSLKTKTGH